RARRRILELRGRGEVVDDATVLADIKARDERDMNRAVAPLRQADDAVLLDTTHLAISPAVQAAIDIVEAVRAGRRPAYPPFDSGGSARSAASSGGLDKAIIVPVERHIAPTRRLRRCQRSCGAFGPRVRDFIYRTRRPQQEYSW